MESRIHWQNVLPIAAAGLQVAALGLLRVVYLEAYAPGGRLPESVALPLSHLLLATGDFLGGGLAIAGVYRLSSNQRRCSRLNREFQTNSVAERVSLRRGRR
jgi:hypothetical protein